MSTRHAAIVAGGGIVGACAALLLQTRARLPEGGVLLVEQTLPEAPRHDEPPDLRVSALSPGSRALLRELGAWRHVDAARVAPYERMRVWPEGGGPHAADALCFDAAEIAAPDLGCIAENRALQAALLRAAAEAGVQLATARVQGVQRRAEDTVLLTDAGEAATPLLVVADGAQSPLREALGVGIEGRSYGQHAIVARLASERPHASTAWQCFLPSGPVALLPLASGEVSLVWSAREERATQLLALDAADFCAELEAVMAPALGRLRLTSERARFPLQRRTADRWCAEGWVLVGDAAHTMHPLAGQGLNQGLGDVRALAEVLARRPARESPGALRALRAWERSRRVDYARVAAVVDGFDRAFTTGAVARLAGRAALAAAARSRLLREAFMRGAAA